MKRTRCSSDFAFINRLLVLLTVLLLAVSIVPSLYLRRQSARRAQRRSNVVMIDSALRDDDNWLALSPADRMAREWLRPRPVPHGESPANGGMNGFIALLPLMSDQPHFNWPIDPSRRAKTEESGNASGYVKVFVLWTKTCGAASTDCLRRHATPHDNTLSAGGQYPFMHANPFEYRSKLPRLSAAPPVAGDFNSNTLLMRTSDKSAPVIPGDIDARTYVGLSTIAGSEPIDDAAF